MPGIDSYTVSLLHFQNRAWTFAGTAQIDTAQHPFASGGSLLLDGDSDYIYSADSADWYFGAGDFTIDFWVRFADLTGNVDGYTGLFQQKTDDSNRMGLFYGGSHIYFGASSSGASVVWVDGSWTPAINTWYHVALERYGNAWNIYVGGSSVGNATDSDPLPDYTGDFWIGKYEYNVKTALLNGWITEFRITKGLARWTTNFTPSSSPYSDDANTISLLHFSEPDGSTYTKDTAANWSIDGAQQFYDEKGKVWTVAGNAQLDTAQYKWTASGLFDGSGDYISTPDHADFNFGSGDFTIDFWLYPLTGTTKCCVWSDVDGPATAIFVNYPNYRSITIAVSTNGTSWNLINPDPGGNGVGTTDKLTVLSWNHVAFVRNGNNWRTYINGTVDLNIAASGTVADSSGTKYIGYLYAGDPCYLYGQLDEFRISKGIARWTSDFTPPTEEYNICIVYSSPALTDTDSALAPSINHVFPIPATDTDSFLVPSINHVFPIPATDTDTMVAPKYNIVIRMPVYLTDSDTVVAPYFGQAISLTSVLTDADIPFAPRIEGIPVPRHRVKVNY